MRRCHLGAAGWCSFLACAKLRAHGAQRSLTRPICRIHASLTFCRPQARGHPQLEAEVVYTARHEYCESAEDFLTRRTRLAFLDIDAATEALPRVRPLKP